MQPLDYAIEDDMPPAILRPAKAGKIVLFSFGVLAGTFIGGAGMIALLLLEF